VTTLLATDDNVVRCEPACQAARRVERALTVETLPGVTVACEIREVQPRVTPLERILRMPAALESPNPPDPYKPGAAAIGGTTGGSSTYSWTSPVSASMPARRL
jgi:hypothetical protein